MLKWYGYLGLILIILTEINFSLKIEPFSDWYVVIVWIGYIMLVDSLVYRIRKKSLIGSYPKEFFFMMLVSVPFWTIFEFYNLFTLSWTYSNYMWYVHPFDFLTIMPAVLETFTLISALNIASKYNATNRKISAAGLRIMNSIQYRNGVKLLVIFGGIVTMLPILLPKIGFSFMWVGLFLLIDPFNYLTGRPSLVQKFASGHKSILLRLFLSGIIMGFFWEFWNYQALPKWQYSLPYVLPGLKLFAMPVLGYLGYLPFALENFLFFALFRSLVFKDHNDILSM